jgi:Ulp1 family protease
VRCSVCLDITDVGVCVRVMFIELTAEQQAVMRRALVGRPADEVLVTEFSISIKRQDMITLAGLNWLNDEVSATYSFN